MNEKKIVVPEGMLEAFWEEFSGGVRGPDSHRRTVDGLEAALRWMAENPIEPNRDEQFALHDAWAKSSKPKSIAGGEIASQILFSVIEWQRRMFLAGPCEHKKVKKYPNYFDAMATVTGITQAPFTYVCEDCGEGVPEPEVPGALRDLLYHSKNGAVTDVLEYKGDADRRIIEAFRRGQKASQR